MTKYGTNLVNKVIGSKSERSRESGQDNKA